MVLVWKEEANRLKDVPSLKAIMDLNVKVCPDFYHEQLALLDDFFSARKEPVDIAIMLYGALFFAYHMAYHLEGNNLLFYRPKSSHARRIDKSFLEGEIHPERTLLIVDEDMVTGKAMGEAYNYFTNVGYAPSSIFGYLYGGSEQKGPIPQLMQIDDLLRK